MTGRQISTFRAIAGGLLLCVLAACYPAMRPVVPAGEAAYDAVPVDLQATGGVTYALQPGDEVSVRIFGEPDLSIDETAIDNAGNISLPLIGDVGAAGLSPTQLAGRIEAAYATNYLRDPRVSVIVRKTRGQTIAVEGEVQLPGVYPYQPGQTLLVAMAQAQSPTEYAKLDQVIVFRTANGRRMAGRFDLQAVRGGRMPDPALLPGDVVVVGYSTIRGVYQDVLRAVPVFGVFRPIG